MMWGRMSINKIRILTGLNTKIFTYYWWLVRATYVVDGRFFGHFFWKVVGSCAHTCESHTRWTHVWWWGQYTHTCVPTATIHGVPYRVNSRVVVGAILHVYLHTVLTFGGGIQTMFDIHMWEFHVWRGHYVGAIHVWRGNVWRGH